MASVQACLFSWLTSEKSLKARCSRLKSCTTLMPETYSCVKELMRRGGGALAAVADADAAAEDAGGEDDERDDGEGDERERPAHESMMPMM